MVANSLAGCFAGCWLSSGNDRKAINVERAFGSNNENVDINTGPTLSLSFRSFRHSQKEVKFLKLT